MEIHPATAGEFRFYGFLRDYHEKDNPHCPVLDLPADKAVVAVLDGQQRLTALNIGLRGSFAPRLKGGWWNNPKAFPKTRLYLNVLSEAEENELGMRHDFRMLREPVTQPDDGSAYWYPVFRLFEIEDIADLMAEVANHNLGNNNYASKLIGDLWKSIHNAGTLYFYEETDQDVEKVLDIFIRVNSGGTTLSYSDLSDTPPLKWAEETYSGDGFNAYLTRNELPGLPADISEFVEWFGRRREALAIRLTTVLDVASEPGGSLSSDS